MNGNAGEWYNAYHGIGAPDMHSVITNIIKGGLLPGDANAYGGSQCRKTKRIIPNPGIYCTPRLETARGYANNLFEFNGGKHRLVLQCRVRPDGVYFCSMPDYWVVQGPQDIRPYGILLYCEEPSKCKCGYRKE